MRHGAGAKKAASEVDFAGQQAGRRLAGKFAEVADEMGLVEVTTLDGGTNPVRVRLFRCAKDALETLHSGEELRRNADGVAKAPLELPDAQTGGPRDGSNANLAGAALQLLHHGRDG